MTAVEGAPYVEHEDSKLLKLKSHYCQLTKKKKENKKTQTTHIAHFLSSTAIIIAVKNLPCFFFFFFLNSTMMLTYSVGETLHFPELFFTLLPTQLSHLL